MVQLNTRLSIRFGFLSKLFLFTPFFKKLAPLKSILMKMLNKTMTFLFLIMLSINLHAQDAQNYNDRRLAVMSQMEEGVCLIYGKNNEDNLNKNFYYLTGLRDTAAILLLCPSIETKMILFTNVAHPADFGIIENTAVYPISNFTRYSYRLISRSPKLWVSFKDLGQIKDFWYLFNAKKEISNYELLLYNLREVKDVVEQKKMAKAIDITANTLKEIFVLLKDGMIENDILSMIDEKQKAKGASQTSFMQAGSGVNGTQVHAEPSDKIIRNGELIVFDVGAYFENYTSDISRTVPVSGKFSKAQKQIYTVVLEAQKAGIRKMQVGILMREVQKIVEDKLLEGLFELGLITDMESQWQRKLYLVHGYYHYIGLDIHDYYSIMQASINAKMYVAGTIMTMEPGLYFPPDLLDKKPSRARNLSDDEFDEFVQQTGPIFEKYKNIGVRIEDDILITEDGNIVLSKNVPKEIKAIEKLMNTK